MCFLIKRESICKKYYVLLGGNIIITLPNGRADIWCSHPLEILLT